MTTSVCPSPFTSARAGDEKTDFRYQLCSAHGLPVEGGWYTYTFRNALIGRVDSRGSLWRDLQDSRTIGFKGGGEPVEKLGKPLIYGGVAVQYFASMVVVEVPDTVTGLAPPRRTV